MRQWHQIAKKNRHQFLRTKVSGLYLTSISQEAVLSLSYPVDFDLFLYFSLHFVNTKGVEDPSSCNSGHLSRDIIFSWL